MNQVNTRKYLNEMYQKIFGFLDTGSRYTFLLTDKDSFKEESKKVFMDQVIDNEETFGEFYSLCTSIYLAKYIYEKQLYDESESLALYCKRLKRKRLILDVDFKQSKNKKIKHSENIDSKNQDTFEDLITRKFSKVKSFDFQNFEFLMNIDKEEKYNDIEKEYNIDASFETIMVLLDEEKMYLSRLFIIQDVEPSTSRKRKSIKKIDDFIDNNKDDDLLNKYTFKIFPLVSKPLNSCEYKNFFYNHILRMYESLEKYMSFMDRWLDTLMSNEECARFNNNDALADYIMKYSDYTKSLKNLFMLPLVNFELNFVFDAEIESSSVVDKIDDEQTNINFDFDMSNEELKNEFYEKIKDYFIEEDIKFVFFLNHLYYFMNIIFSTIMKQYFGDDLTIIPTEELMNTKHKFNIYINNLQCEKNDKIFKLFNQTVFYLKFLQDYKITSLDYAFGKLENDVDDAKNSSE